MKAKIFFSKFDTKEINTNPKGWMCKEGEMYLNLTHPLEGKCIDGVNVALANGKFIYVGEIDVNDEHEAWSKVQNIDTGHELNNRSMMMGDVVLFENEGFVAESIDFSRLNNDQFNKFKNLL